MSLLLNTKKAFVFIILSLFTNAAFAASEGYADIVAPLIPAVVSISSIYQDTPLELHENSQSEDIAKFFERFEKNSEEDTLGSGFIISPDGYIVTNYHVIDKAEKIIVTLSNDQKLEANLIGFDNRTDLALLKVESKIPLPFVNFGNSDENRVGDLVLAIGNPFGLGSTVTSGIISSQARNIKTDSTNIIDNFIQTDAAINEGNSGGPIFNMKGEVIGISFFIMSPTGANIGIGFAVPSSLAKPIIDQLVKDGKVHHGWIGIATQSTEDGVGTLISSVAKGSPAEKSGIKVGDVILKFDNKAITHTQGLPRIVAETPVGKKVSVEIMSKGKLKKISLTIEEIETKPKTISIKSAYGMNLSRITSNLNLAQGINGILVSELDPKGLAAKHGIKAGDVISSADKKPLKNPEDLFAVIKNAKANQQQSIMLLITREDGNVFLSLPSSE